MAETNLLNLNPKAFEKTIDGKKVRLFHLENDHGMSCLLTNYGASIVKLYAPDRSGNLDNVVLGYPSLADYLNDKQSCMGAVVGRFANRIRNAEFAIDEEIYKLDKNQTPHHIHGGFTGFHHKVWEVKQQSDQSIQFGLFSPHLEGGFPGNLIVTVTYSLTNSNELEIRFEATTDQATHINLTNHTYFNLNQKGIQDTIVDHQLQINALEYLPIDDAGIPLGEKDAVQGTPFDFTQARNIGAQLAIENDQLSLGNGFDHTFVLSAKTQTIAATLWEAESGRKMEVMTSEPGIQLYTGNGLGTSESRTGTQMGPRSGMCLETQHFPNSPNQSSYPSTLLKPDQVFRSFTSYRFSTF